MSLRGRIFVMMFSLVWASACADDPSAPQGALVGRFGGQAAEINLSADMVDARFGCGLFRAAGAVIPDSAGRFVVTLAPRPGNGSTSATIRGQTDGATIDADVTIVFAGAQGTSRFTVRKGVPPDYTILSCTVPTP
jgi:hypothetical protein